MLFIQQFIFTKYFQNIVIFFQAITPRRPLVPPSPFSTEGPWEFIDLGKALQLVTSCSQGDYSPSFCPKPNSWSRTSSSGAYLTPHAIAPSSRLCFLNVTPFLQSYSFVVLVQKSLGFLSVNLNEFASTISWQHQMSFLTIQTPCSTGPLLSILPLRRPVSGSVDVAGMVCPL